MHSFKLKAVLNILIETERLLIRKFTEEDAAFIFKLVNTSQWLQNIGDRNVHSFDDARKYLQDVHFRSYNENGFGHYVVTLKNNKVPVGICGFLKRDTLPGADIGFAFLPEFFGRGYAFESAAALLQFGREQLKFPSLFAIVLPSNLPSIKLLGKLGFLFEKKIRLIPEGDELQLFSHPSFILKT